MSTMSIIILTYHQNKVLDLISVTTGTCNFQILTPLDTVGAVCVDAYGNLAAACSSGGVALKHPGRVGQVSLFHPYDHLCTLTAK
jgi:isoaspartyl peptidase/L-asparaginase-like protein (Ntn-hydrolase superfamily)